MRDAGAYPERNVPRFSGLTTPAVYFSINSWEQGGGNEGQLSVNLTCDLFVVVDAAGSGVSQPEIFVRTAAADITQWIDGQQFGLGHIEPAVFTTAERDEFDPRMDDYLVWRISYTQAAAFGTDPLHTMACLCSRPGWVLHLIRAVITWMTISLSGRLSPMSDIAGDLQRRLANLVRRGVIHSVRHDRIPKCRVDLGDIITTWLPLCQGFSRS